MDEAEDSGNDADPKRAKKDDWEACSNMWEFLSDSRAQEEMDRRFGGQGRSKG